MFRNALELIQNIRRWIDYKKPSNTKQVNKAQNIRIKVWKYKSCQMFENINS